MAKETDPLICTKMIDQQDVHPMWPLEFRLNILAVTGKGRFFLFRIKIEVQFLSVIIKVTTSRACVSSEIKWITATAIIWIIYRLNNIHILFFIFACLLKPCWYSPLSSCWSTGISSSTSSEPRHSTNPCNNSSHVSCRKKAGLRSS